MGKFTKAITALISSGGLSGVAMALGMPENVTGDMVAAISAVVAVVTSGLVWLFPNQPE